MEENLSTNTSPPSFTSILMATPFREPASFRHFAFIIILLVYLVTVVGNLLLCLVIYRESNLHKPMYVLMALLSVTDVVETTNSLPRIMTNLMSYNNVSLSECMTQMFFFVSNARVTKAFLAIVAFSVVPGVGYVGMVLRLSFCRPLVTFAPNCDFMVLTNLACSDVYYNIVYVYANVFVAIILPLLVVALAYCLILFEFRKRSLRQNQRAFQTCMTHLVIICIYFGSILFTIGSGLQFFSGIVREVRVPLQSLQYVIPPVLNPIVYGLRTDAIRRGVLKMVRQKISMAKAE
uniref:G-protein coupled receptors family 1 profile domain-containing protein n=1 Tax=Petromyzon marinus TaxID=7757 RepID=S4RL17_PETMA